MHKFEKRDAKSRTLVILAVVGLAAAITVGIFTAIRLIRKPAQSKDDSKTGIVYDDAAIEGGWDNLSPGEIAEKLNEKVAEGMINISMNTAPYFEDGKAEGNVMIVNESIHMIVWTDQETVLKRDAVVKLRSVMTNSIFQAEPENLYIRKDAAYKDVTEAARAVMHDLVDRMESVADPPASIQQKLLELALELRTVSGKKQYAYLKKPLKDMVDSIVDELEKLPEVAAYYSVWNGLRDTLEGYYKNRPRQHNPLAQQKEFRAIKNAIIQEAERLRQEMEQMQTAAECEHSQDEKASAEETSTDASTNPTLADENTSSAASHHAQPPAEYLLNSTVRLFHQMGQIFRDNAAPPSNPMGIRIDSKRRKKLMQKRLALGHKQDDHEQEQGYNLDIR